MAEKNSLWKNIRANRGSGKKPTTEMLRQERKIKAEYAKGGPVGDDELYNMRRAVELGYTPDETGHWPSVDSETGMFLKSKEHPTAWMEYLYGHTLNPELNRTTNVVVNPEGYFGDNQLQYIPKKQYAEGSFVGEDGEDGKLPKLPSNSYVNKEGVINGPVLTKDGWAVPKTKDNTPIVNLREAEIISTPTGEARFNTKLNPYSPTSLKEAAQTDAWKAAKLGVDAASLFGFYPANVAGSVMDLIEGDYSGAAMGLVPVVGRAGKHGKFWRDAYTKGINAGLPHKVIFPLKKYGKQATILGSNITQAADSYDDLVEPYISEVKDAVSSFNKEQKATGGYYPTQGPPKALFKGYANGGYIKQYDTGSFVTEEGEDDLGKILADLRKQSAKPVGSFSDWKTQSTKPASTLPTAQENFINTTKDIPRNRKPVKTEINYTTKEQMAARPYPASGSLTPVYPEALLAAGPAVNLAKSALGTVGTAMSTPLTVGSTTIPGLTANNLLTGYFASKVPGNLQQGEYVDAVLNGLPMVGPVLKESYNAAKTVAPIIKNVANAPNTKLSLAFQSPAERLVNPEAYRVLTGRSSGIRGNILEGYYNLQQKNIYKAQNKLGNKIRNARISNKDDLADLFVEKRSALYKDSDKLQKKINDWRLKYSGLPITRTNMGGGQGSIFKNNLNQNELIKVGSYFGNEQSLNNLVELGKTYNNPNVAAAFPTKAIPFTKAIESKGFVGESINAAQFMPKLDYSRGLYSANQIMTPEQIKFHLNELNELGLGIDYTTSAANIGSVGNKLGLVDLTHVGPAGKRTTNYFDREGLFNPEYRNEEVLGRFKYNVEDWSRPTQQAKGGYTMKNNQSWREYLQYAQGGYTNPYNQYQDDQYLKYDGGGGYAWGTFNPNNPPEAPAVQNYAMDPGQTSGQPISTQNPNTDKQIPNLNANANAGAKDSSLQQSVYGANVAGLPVGAAIKVQDSINQGLQTGTENMLGKKFGIDQGQKDILFAASHKTKNIPLFGSTLGKFGDMYNLASGKTKTYLKDYSRDKRNQETAMHADLVNESLKYSQGGNMSNNSLNLHNTMRYKRFAQGGTLEQQGINFITDDAGLHHQSANGGVPIGPNALAEGGEAKLQMADGGQYIVSDQVDGANTQTINGQTMAERLKKRLKPFMMGGLASNPKDKDNLRRPFDSYSAESIAQVKDNAIQENESVRMKTGGALQYAAHGGRITPEIKKLVEAERKRLAQEEYSTAYNGIDIKKHGGLNYSRGGKVSNRNVQEFAKQILASKGGYVHNQMTQPMYAQGGNPWVPPDKELANMGYAPDQIEAIKLADQQSPVFESEEKYKEAQYNAARATQIGDPRGMGIYNAVIPKRLDEALRVGTPLQSLQNSVAKPVLDADLIRSKIEDYDDNKMQNSFGESYEDVIDYERRRAREIELENMYGPQDDYARGGQINYTNDMYSMYAGGGPMVSNVNQPFRGPSAQNRGGMYIYADGGMMPSEQQMMQQQQMQQQQAPQQQMQQQGGQDQMMQMVEQVMQALMQGANPEQIMQQLVQSGVPQDMAMQAVQMAMQEVQGQMQQQGQQQPMQEGQQPMQGQEQQMPPQQGMARGGYKYAKSGPVIDPVKLKAEGYVEYDEYFYNPKTGQYVDKPSTNSSQEDAMYQKNIEKFMQPGIQFDERTIKPLLGLVNNTGIEQMPIDLGLTTSVGGVKKPGMENVIGDESYVEGTRYTQPNLRYNSSTKDYSGKYNLQYVDPYTLGGNEMMDQRYPILDRNDNIQLTPENFNNLQTVGARSDSRNKYFKSQYDNIKSIKDRANQAYQSNFSGVNPTGVDDRGNYIFNQPASVQNAVVNQPTQPTEQPKNPLNLPGMADMGSSEYNSINSYLTNLNTPNYVDNQGNTSSILGRMSNNSKPITPSNTEPITIENLNRLRLKPNYFDTSNSYNPNPTLPNNELGSMTSTAPTSPFIPEAMPYDDEIDYTKMPYDKPLNLTGWKPAKPADKIPGPISPNTIGPNNIITEAEAIAQGYNPQATGVTPPIVKDKELTGINDRPSWVDIGIGASQLAGPLHQFFQEKPKPFQYDKMQATTLNPTAAIVGANEELRRAQDTAGYGIKQNAPTSGSYLANIRALALQLGKQRGAATSGIQQQYDIQNAGILNQMEQQNTEIENRNIDAIQQDLANFQEQRTNALYNAGANIAGMRKDYKANEINQIIAKNLGTNNWEYDQATNTFKFRNPNGQMISVPAATVLSTNPTTTTPVVTPTATQPAQANTQPAASTQPAATTDAFIMPNELQKGNETKAFQDFLDAGDIPWYKGSKLKRGKGYGTFGPNTKAAYAKYKDEYAKKQKEAARLMYNIQNPNNPI